MRLFIPPPMQPGPQVLTLQALETFHSFGRDNIRWRFSATDGAEMTTFTTARLGRGSRARALLEAIAGHPLDEGADFDTAALIGRSCRAVVGTKPNGFPTIESVSAA